MAESQLYFKQLLAGRDFGKGNPIAAQMQNYVYLVGDRAKGECVVVDPAWAVRDLVEIAGADGMTITGALVTHYHPDHIGGDLWGHEVDGLATLMEVAPCPVHCHTLEAEGVRKLTGLSKSDLVEHRSGDKVTCGDIEVELLHTPGHTPGSLCFCVADSLVSGDTLFLQGCGRVDLPGGDSDQMFASLQKLKQLPQSCVVFPGHAYSGDQAPMGDLLEDNHYLRIEDLATWHALFGR